MGSIVPKKRAYHSRVRRITACVECHRRKQKCNRETPCNICKERGVPDRCVYHDQNPKKQDPDGDAPRERPSVDDRRLLVDEPGLTTLSTGLGYASNASNTPNHAAHSTVLSDLRPSGKSSRHRLTAQQSMQLRQLLTILPGLQTAQKLVNVFFDEANWYFTVLDRHFFSQSHRAWLRWQASQAMDFPPGDLLYFPALLFQVLAMALQFLPPSLKLETDVGALQQPTFEHMSHRFSDAGENVLALLGRRTPELSSIEADLMRCTWLKNSGNGYEAWYSLGNAVRQAQDIGLHLEPSEPQGEHYSAEYLHEAWRNEHRRRIWALIISWEAHMAIQLGRPRMINIADCTVRKPIDCDVPPHPAQTLLRSAGDEEPPSRYTSQLVKYEMAILIHKSLSLGLSSQSMKSSREHIAAMHRDVDEFLDTLPLAFRYENPDTSWDACYPEIVKQRVQIQIVAKSFLTTLYRPHVGSHSQSLDTAVHAAKDVLDLIQVLFDLSATHQHKAFTLLFYTIDAGIFLAAILAKPHFDIARSTREALLSTLGCSVRRLQLMKSDHNAAIAGERVLRSCLEQVRRLSGEQSQVQDSVSKHSSEDLQLYHQNSTSTDQSVNDYQDYDELFSRIMNDPGFTSAWLDENLDNYESLDFSYMGQSHDWNISASLNGYQNYA